MRLRKSGFAAFAPVAMDNTLIGLVLLGPCQVANSVDSLKSLNGPDGCQIAQIKKIL